MNLWNYQTHFYIRILGLAVWRNLVLSDENENVLDSVFTSTLETDMSLGRTLEGMNWNIFSIPSLGNPMITLLL